MKGFEKMRKMMALTRFATLLGMALFSSRAGVMEQAYAQDYCSDPWGVCGAACNHSSYPWNICMQKCTCHATCECDEGQSGEYCKSVCS